MTLSMRNLGYKSRSLWCSAAFYQNCRKMHFEDCFKAVMKPWRSSTRDPFREEETFHQDLVYSQSQKAFCDKATTKIQARASSTQNHCLSKLRVLIFLELEIRLYSLVNNAPGLAKINFIQSILTAGKPR